MTRSRRHLGLEMTLALRSYYDGLGLCFRLGRTLKAVAPAEIHLFGYLASVLSTYRGRPAGEWGYRFALTPDGFPFSADLELALAQLTKRGQLTPDEDGYLEVTERGRAERTRLFSLSFMSANEEFLEGACSVTLAMPVGLVRAALGGEGDLRRVAHGTRSELLPTDLGDAVRQEQFRVLHSVLPEAVSDLLLPASVWLFYLWEGIVHSESEEGINDPQP